MQAGPWTPCSTAWTTASPPITLNRPDKLNAFTAKMRDELIAVFDETDADDAVRAVIVTGAGRAFCAGADLSSGGQTFDYAARQDAARDENRVGDVYRDGGGMSPRCASSRA
jgi:enoyl-CoA hydratase/carnithine racemase